MTLLRRLIVITFTLFAAYCNAQLGTWNIVNAKINLNNKWSAFAEAQLRSLSFYNNFHYYEYKGGVNYKLDKNFSFTTGIGKYKTYSEGGSFKEPVMNNEIRTWLQINMSQYVGKLKFDHRYRAEQRFSTTGFKQRYRYRLSLAVPLFKQEIDAKTFFINANNEIFFGNNQPYLERNRFFCGIGYEFTQHFTLIGGILNQTDYKVNNDETGKSFLQLSCLFEIERKKRKGEYVPTSAD